MLPAHVLWCGMRRHKIFKHFVLASSDGQWGNYIAHVLETLLAGGLTEMLASVRMQYLNGGDMHQLLKKLRDQNSSKNIDQLKNPYANVDRAAQLVDGEE